jgi:hypothetical protein
MLASPIAFVVVQERFAQFIKRIASNPNRSCPRLSRRRTAEKSAIFYIMLEMHLFV